MRLSALVGPLFPPLLAPCLLYLSFLGVLSALPAVFPFWCPRGRALCCPRAPCVCPCSSLCYPCLAAPRPLTRSSPLPFSATQPPCLLVCPLCLCRAVTRVCHPRVLPLPLSVVPTLFPCVSPTLVFPSPVPPPCRGEQGTPFPRAGSALWMRLNSGPFLRKVTERAVSALHSDQLQPLKHGLGKPHQNNKSSSARRPKNNKHTNP